MAKPRRQTTLELIFQDHSEGSHLPNLAQLTTWLETVVADVCANASTLGVCFVEDREMQEANGRYRGKDAPTDVLSFPGETTDDGLHLGDIMISLPTARRQACERGHSVQLEISLLLLHGVLHCMGWDHEADSGEMVRRELELRQRFLS